MTSTLRLFALFAALVLLQACKPAVDEIELIVPTLVIDREIAEQIRDLINEDAGMRIRMVPLPDEFASVPEALDAGYGDIGFAPNSAEFRDNVTTIMPIYPTILHVVALAGRSVGSVDELLAGASVFAGPPGSAPRLLSEQIIDDFILEPGTVEFVDDHLADIDVVVMYVPIDRDRVLAEPGLENATMFSFNRPEDVGRGSLVDRAVLFHPSLRPYIIPTGTYGDLTPEPVVTLAVDQLIIGRKDLDRALVYDLIDEILGIRPALLSDRPELFQPLGDHVISSYFAFAVHPGTHDYVTRDEPTFVERYSGVAEVLVTLIIGVISGLFAIMKIYRIRRKNRIDEFYIEAITIRDSVSGQSTVAERNAAIERIHDLKNRAFKALVDERVAADESFRIFIELTHDSIDEINALPPA